MCAASTAAGASRSYAEDIRVAEVERVIAMGTDAGCFIRTSNPRCLGRGIHEFIVGELIGDRR
jgi:hypothetical protein